MTVMTLSFVFIRSANLHGYFLTYLEEPAYPNQENNVNKKLHFLKGCKVARVHWKCLQKLKLLILFLNFNKPRVSQCN